MEPIACCREYECVTVPRVSSYIGRHHMSLSEFPCVLSPRVHKKKKKTEVCIHRQEDLSPGAETSPYFVPTNVYLQTSVFCYFPRVSSTSPPSVRHKSILVWDGCTLAFRRECVELVEGKILASGAPCRSLTMRLYVHEINLMHSLRDAYDACKSCPVTLQQLFGIC